eukprot:7998468-Lingulodinium_polyedra.AAC.1
MRTFDQLQPPSQRLERQERREVQLVDLRAVLKDLGDEEVLVDAAVPARDAGAGHPRVVTSHRPFVPGHQLPQEP